jgi:hypothetical protein
MSAALLMPSGELEIEPPVNSNRQSLQLAVKLQSLIGNLRDRSN